MHCCLPADGCLSERCFYSHLKWQMNESENDDRWDLSEEGRCPRNWKSYWWWLIQKWAAKREEDLEIRGGGCRGSTHSSAATPSGSMGFEIAMRQTALKKYFRHDLIDHLESYPLGGPSEPLSRYAITAENECWNVGKSATLNRFHSPKTF